MANSPPFNYMQLLTETNDTADKITTHNWFGLNIFVELSSERKLVAAEYLSNMQLLSAAVWSEWSARPHSTQ